MGFNIMSKNKKLYDDMRDAIERNDHQSMSKIIRDQDYQPNNMGEGEGKEKMTALHMATLKEDPEALSILLQLEKIDPNAKLPNGFTPLLLAAARGRMISFEILIGDERVDVDARDNENHTATDLVKAHGKMIMAKRAKELLARRSCSSQEEAGEQAIVKSNNTPEVSAEERKCLSKEAMLEWKTPNVGFDKLLATQAGRELFGSFLEKEFSSENLKFWIACQQLKQVKEASQFSRHVEAIFNNYIDPSALNEISLKGCVKESLQTKKEKPPRDIFEEAQSDTYSLMHMDSFPRFLSSRDYKEAFLQFGN